MADGYIMRRGGTSSGSGGNGGERMTGTFMGNGTTTVTIPELIGKTSFVIYLYHTERLTDFAISAVSYGPRETYCVVSAPDGSGLPTHGNSSDEYPSYKMSFDADTGILNVPNPGAGDFLSGATYRFESIE